MTTVNNIMNIKRLAIFNRLPKQALLCHILQTYPAPSNVAIVTINYHDSHTNLIIYQFVSFLHFLILPYSSGSQTENFVFLGINWRVKQLSNRSPKVYVLQKIFTLIGYYNALYWSNIIRFFFSYIRPQCIAKDKFISGSQIFTSPSKFIDNREKTMISCRY